VFECRDSEQENRDQERVDEESPCIEGPSASQVFEDEEVPGPSDYELTGWRGEGEAQGREQSKG